MAFSELEFLADQLRLSSRGDAWHGPPLGDLLDGVSDEMSMKKPVDVHSIREIVEHIRSWVSVSRGAIDEIPMPPSSGWAEDWPVTSDSWDELKKSVADEIEKLAEAVEDMEYEQLSRTVPGRNYDYRFLLYGIVQHTLYHAGQIALLKKL